MDRLALVFAGTVALFVVLLWQELVSALPGSPGGRVQLIVLVGIGLLAIIAYYLMDSDR